MSDPRISPDVEAEHDELGELTPEEIEAIRAARRKRRPPARGTVAVPSSRARLAYRVAGVVLGGLLALMLLARLARLAADNPLAAVIVLGIAVLILRSHGMTAARHSGRAWRWMRDRRRR